MPRSAARPLRYMDRYVTVTQGEVMCITELLANLEGLERGPAGNTSLAAAFCLAQELPEDQILVVSETEYTGAGKHVQPQLDFARENGIEVRFGKPGEEVPGVSVIRPADPISSRSGIWIWQDAPFPHQDGPKDLVRPPPPRRTMSFWPRRPTRAWIGSGSRWPPSCPHFERGA